MTDVWIDTDRVLRASTAWHVQADALHRTAVRLEADLHDLALGSQGAGPHHLTAAATELWVTSSFARLAVERAERADGSFDPARSDSVARLRSLAGASVQQSMLGACAPTWAEYSFSSVFGDIGETGDREVRSPYLTVGSSPTERGRNLLMRTMADTGDDRQIRVDEFQVVRLDNGKFVVVLPGVTDLSSPDLGWSDDHRSVRDLDQGAFWSSRTTSVDDNPYARMVRDGLVAAGVPSGADLLIVGHSYGADTALDLAADASFNGPDGYRVSHVVAAAYHSDPQLPHVPNTTAVLVLQNHRDVPVIVEAIGSAHVTDGLVDRGEALADLAALDLAGAGGNLASAFGNDLGALWAGAKYTAAHLDDLGEAGAGLALADPEMVADGIGDFVTLDPGITRPAPGQIVDVFAGGGDGLGHHQQHYLAHLDGVDDVAVQGFLAALDAAGYTAPGVALAVDVSVPSA